MCTASSECSARQACVVGRCQDPNGVPLIQKKEVRRQVVDPVAMAYVQRGTSAANGALPPIFTLGRADGGGARLYLRFAVPLLAKDVSILEAYVLLDRSAGIQADPTPIALHAARVVDAWEPQSISWNFQPRFEEPSAGSRAPTTRIVPAARHVVRVDVRDIVRRWYLRDGRDQGIVIVADNSTAVGMAFALASGWGPGGTSFEGASDRDAVTSSSLSAPRLEMYTAPAVVH